MPANKTAEKESMMDLVKDRELLFRLLKLCVIWLTILLGYYGLSLASVNLSGDPYLNLFLSSIVEIPGKLNQDAQSYFFGLCAVVWRDRNGTWAI